MEDELKKGCVTCENCKGYSDPDKDEGRVKYRAKDDDLNFIKLECGIHGEMRFPRGSIPVCWKWEEKAPTLKELRDEVRELKKQLRRRNCTEGTIIKYEYLNCCHDCCKCKCRCNRYNPPYVSPYWYTHPNWTTTPYIPDTSNINISEPSNGSFTTTTAPTDKVKWGMYDGSSSGYGSYTMK